MGQLETTNNHKVVEFNEKARNIEEKSTTTQWYSRAPNCKIDQMNSADGD